MGKKDLIMEQKLILQADVPAFPSVLGAILSHTWSKIMFRRGLFHAFWSGLDTDPGEARPMPSEEVGSVAYDEKWLQHLIAHARSGLKLNGSLTEKINLRGLCVEPDPMFQSFPCSQLSKGPMQRPLQKKIAKYIDSGDQNEGNMLQHPSEALQNTHVTRKRKSKADSSDSKDYMSCSLVHKKQTGTKKKKGKADSNDSETYDPPQRSRGQIRNSLRCSNSIAQQGMLDSKMFELYFENIWSRISEEKRKSFAYLDSLWFNLYTKSCYKEKVLNWIKRKDIFSKKYVLVPIIMWSHWSLLILCHFGEESKSRRPCMILLDSLQAANQSLEPQIQKFVSDIHKMEGMPTNRQWIQKIPLLVPKVPQQRNGEECGCYVLFYINLFLENAPESFSISDGYPYFMKEDWFTVESLDNFRHWLGSVLALCCSSDE